MFLLLSPWERENLTYAKEIEDQGYPIDVCLAWITLNWKDGLEVQKQEEIYFHALIKLGHKMENREMRFVENDYLDFKNIGIFFETNCDQEITWIETEVEKAFFRSGGFTKMELNLKDRNVNYEIEFLPDRIRYEFRISPQSLIDQFNELENGYTLNQCLAKMEFELQSPDEEMGDDRTIAYSSQLLRYSVLFFNYPMFAPLHGRFISLIDTRAENRDQIFFLFEFDCDSKKTLLERFLRWSKILAGPEPDLPKFTISYQDLDDEFRAYPGNNR